MKAEDLHKLAAVFPKEDVHWRAQTVTRDGKKALALAYIDARDVMERLDTVCGVNGWQSKHYDAGAGRLGCHIGVLVESEWIWKSDGAGATDVEADKGAFSDALKRAAVSWGVGRYLYGLGNTYVPCEADELPNGKWRFIRFTDDPWQHVKNAEKFTWRGPLRKMELQNEMKRLSERMNSGALATTGDLDALETEYAHVIDQAQTDKPDWWRGFDRRKKELLTTLLVGPTQSRNEAAE